MRVETEDIQKWHMCKFQLRVQYQSRSQDAIWGGTTGYLSRWKRTYKPSTSGNQFYTWINPVIPTQHQIFNRKHQVLFSSSSQSWYGGRAILVYGLQGVRRPKPSMSKNKIQNVAGSQWLTAKSLTGTRRELEQAGFTLCGECTRTWPEQVSSYPQIWYHSSPCGLGHCIQTRPLHNSVPTLGLQVEFSSTRSR